MAVATDTNVEDVAQNLTAQILRDISSLESAVVHLRRVVSGRKPGNSIPIGWVENVQQPLTSITNDIARINGAMLVRSAS